MDLFWRRGYDATSIDDLVEHLGITRPALYREWGSKQSLYQASLQRYRSEAGRAFVTALDSRPESVVNTLRDRLREIVAEAVTSTDRRGCFVVNATCERAATDTATQQQVAAVMKGLAARIERALREAVERGAIDHPDPAALARFMVVVIQGLRVVGKADPGSLEGVVDQAMSAVNPVPA
jgi:TetR/AcrR family transcriptional repressor of nem operon